MPVQIRHLHYVIAAAEHGSFRRAAEALTIRQSALSRRISELEDELGVPLFFRSPRGVRLTLAGEKFIGHGRKALAQIRLAMTAVGAGAALAEGTLRIGINAPLASGFLSDLISSFAATQPHVRLHFLTAPLPDQVAALRQSTLDLAFLGGAPHWSGCETEPLWSERLHVALQVTDPRARQPRLTFADFCGDNFLFPQSPPGDELKAFLEQRLDDLGQTANLQVQNVGRDDLLQLVAVGAGLVLTGNTARAAPPNGVVFRPIEDEILVFSAVWSAEADSAARDRLLDLARQLSATAAYHARGQPEIGFGLRNARS